MSSTMCGLAASAGLYWAHLLAQAAIDLLRVRRIERDQEGEHAGPLHVLQEAETQALAGVRSFDDARDVGHDETPMPGEPDDAEVGLERGEGIVGDLGPRGRDDARAACSCRRWARRPGRRRR